MFYGLRLLLRNEFAYHPFRSHLKIDNLSSEALEKGADDIGPLLDDTRLWAFTSHVNPGVRRACYSMLRTVTSKAPSLIKDRLPIISKQFLPAVFNDKDITTHGDLWDSLLVFTRAFPESWIIPADKKPTMTLFFSFLKHAGYGSTTVTYRSILPLISTWADESVLGKNGTGFPFVQDFFESFWRGIESSNMDRDPGATGLFLEAYIECLVYFIVRFGSVLPYPIVCLLFLYSQRKALTNRLFMLVIENPRQLNRVRMLFLLPILLSSSSI